jgi:hypothetical protein
MDVLLGLSASQRLRHIADCVFHVIPDTHFTGSRTAFHADGGHDFTLMADSVSR